VLWADSFNAAFEPENLDAALKLLTAAGYRVHVAKPTDGARRPLCCGRTFLAVGDVDSAKAEMTRTLAAVEPMIERGLPVIGLEPSCLYTFRDEAPALMPGEATAALAARVLSLEEFMVGEAERFSLLAAPVAEKVFLHGHCHQKAFGAMGAVQGALELAGLAVETIESSCCGMAGAFGYQAETIETSMAMGELSLLPAVRKAPPAAVIVADGTSCRCQIEQGTGRRAVHVARLLADRLAAH
jgi:Fe-S oxidoreductase